MLTKLKLDDNAPVKEQISDFLRHTIATGVLPPGAPLASTRKLADLWGVPLSTVQSGLKPLVSEGLLVRVVGRGTRVRSQKRALTTVGVYDRYDIEHVKTSQFQRTLHSALSRLLSGDGIHLRPFVDYRTNTGDEPSPLPELQRAGECGDIQGLIAPSIRWDHLRWLTKLPVPVTILGTSNLPNLVRADFDQFWDLALGYLREQGCRSVGLISALPEDDMDPTVTCFGQNHQVFIDTAARVGLELREEWIFTPGIHSPVSVQQYGYESFMGLWALPEHPEGLIVGDDVTTRGVITAILNERVQVPEQLQFVTHKNNEVELLCPFPAALVEVDVSVTAATLISHLKRQFYEQRLENMRFPFRLTHTTLARSAIRPPGMGSAG